MQLAEGTTMRASRRGLIIVPPDGATVLVEHDRSDQLLAVLGSGAGVTADAVAGAGFADADEIVADLTAAGLLTEDGMPAPDRAPTRRRWAITRSGIEADGIETPARWIDAHLVRLLLSWPGRLLVVGVVAIGMIALAAGRADGPAVSSTPIAEALIGIAIAWTVAAAHELGHAVTLIHFGRRPRRAGMGFYWGGLSFYVDSTEACTLPRRQRVIQSVAGLMVDVLAVSVLAILAQVTDSTLLLSVCWRLALVGVIDIAVNALPILKLDGYWALSDWLDDPDLSERARAALRGRLGGATRTTSTGLAGYGALSIAGGIVLTIVSAVAWWAVAHDLLVALFTGTWGGVLVGLMIVTPLLVGTLASCLGLLREALPHRTGREEVTT